MAAFDGEADSADLVNCVASRPEGSGPGRIVDRTRKSVKPGEDSVPRGGAEDGGESRIPAMNRWAIAGSGGSGNDLGGASGAEALILEGAEDVGAKSSDP